MNTAIKHNDLGEIAVEWDDERLLVTSIGINSAIENDFTVDNKLMKMRFPELYTFLSEYDGVQKHQFPVECLDLSWTTPFFRTVYRALLGIKAGQAVTYSELAALCGSPRASRAVGNAMNKNRFLIAIPCHRVIGKKYLGNFRAGIEIKKILLTLEGRADLLS